MKQGSAAAFAGRKRVGVRWRQPDAVLAYYAWYVVSPAYGRYVLVHTAAKGGMVATFWLGCAMRQRTMPAAEGRGRAVPA
ncbi:hypothetical protein NPIL_151971 [Nephila pilipes]|uniref:Uncharacterized protein n=1 Tax=Nephila pilipes TaxID=299642 RepID=A0A8X6UUT0_NEPPI|nr:hypothetical protein NPIL_151971 [Nephila pilipes]